MTRKSFAAWKNSWRHETGQFEIHNVLEDYGAAEELYQKSLTTMEGNVEPEAKCFVLLIREYARLLDVTGRANEASRLRASKGRVARP